MSAFKEAVQQMKDTGGWRSEGKPEEPCPKCRNDNCVVWTTIYARTTAFCNICAHEWTP